MQSLRSMPRRVLQLWGWSKLATEIEMINLEKQNKKMHTSATERSKIVSENSQVAAMMSPRKNVSITNGNCLVKSNRPQEPFRKWAANGRRKCDSTGILNIIGSWMERPNPKMARWVQEQRTENTNMARADVIALTRREEFGFCNI